MAFSPGGVVVPGYQPSKQYTWNGVDYGNAAAMQQAQQQANPVPGPSGAIPTVQQGGAGSVANVGPNGSTSYSVTPNTQAFDAEQAKLASDRAAAAATQQQQLTQTGASNLLNQRASLNAEAESRRMAELSTMSGTTGTSPHVGTAGQPFDEVGARNAAFAAAKDQAGQVALSSVKALQDVMDARGINGSSIEANNEGQILGGAAGSLGGFTREQLMQDLSRAAQVSDRNYQGNVTQRGQDMAQLPSLLGLITAAGSVY